MGGLNLSLGPAGKLYAGTFMDGFQTVDLATKVASPLVKLQVLCPDTTHPNSVFPAPHDLAALPDPPTLVFAALYFSGKAGDGRAQVLYACAPDGSAARLVTKPVRDVVPAYVFPATGKAAF